LITIVSATNKERLPYTINDKIVEIAKAAPDKEQYLEVLRKGVIKNNCK
jgi:hypothetical protein